MTLKVSTDYNVNDLPSTNIQEESSNNWFGREISLLNIVQNLQQQAIFAASQVSSAYSNFQSTATDIASQLSSAFPFIAPAQPVDCSLTNSQPAQESLSKISVISSNESDSKPTTPFPISNASSVVSTNNGNCEKRQLEVASCDSENDVVVIPQPKKHKSSHPLPITKSAGEIHTSGVNEEGVNKRKRSEEPSVKFKNKPVTYIDTEKHCSLPKSTQNKSLESSFTKVENLSSSVFSSMPSAQNQTGVIPCTSSSSLCSVAKISNHSSDSREEIESAKKDTSKVTDDEPKTANKTTLFTAEITNTDMIGRIKTITEKWMRTAQTRCNQSYGSKDGLSSVKFDGYENKWFPYTILMTGSSLRTLTEMHFNSWSCHNVYVTYDDHNKVQAIALGRDNEIVNIATNPDNIIVFANDKNPVRGAGTALIKHIALKLKKSHCEGGIHLKADSDAIPYYERRGFSVVLGTYMKLDGENMNKFLESRKDLGIVVEEPPETLT